MKYRIRFLGEAGEALKHFPPDIKRLVRRAIDDILKNPWAGEPLVRELRGYWKYRAGHYRILYKFGAGQEEVFVSLIDERESVYDRLRKMLAG